METLNKMIKNIINKDGGNFISVNKFDSVLILKADLNSVPQIERFCKVGSDLGFINNPNVEMRKDSVVLVATV